MIELSLTIGGETVGDIVKKIKKNAEKNLSILGKCKFRLFDGAKIKFKHDVNASVEKTKMGKLENLLFKENVVVDKVELKSSITTTTLATAMETVTALETLNGYTAKRQTVVITMNKSDITESFDMLKDTTLGEILRTTFFPLVYKKVADQWKELNNGDKSDSTNVLYVPDVLYYLNDATGKIKHTLTFINVLILAIPDKKYIKNGEVENRTDDEMYIGRIIGDILDASIRVEAKDVIFNPFEPKALKKDTSITANCWKVITSSKRVLENMNSIILTTDNVDADFITLNAVFS